ncbi:MAG: hypothetical protein WAK45_06915 [Methanoregula sp.]|uniref:hypothetical protein n=2 Tax=Methanoregula sp. TaxID=2052170 RepID=UPI003BAE8F08
MKPGKWLKDKFSFKALRSAGQNEALDPVFLLTLFLVAVLLISFIIPVLHYGRFFGTDDYTHLFQTQQMAISSGISDFYEKMGNFVTDPSSGDNQYNYPFGLWLFGSIIAKITGLSVTSGVFILNIIFLLIIIGSFYIYSDAFLEIKDQKIFALLFLISMPNVTLLLLSYRPSIFILPFLFILIYIAIKEPFQWKLLPIIWLSSFVIIISHTGTFIFLVSFSIIFYLLYCLIWGKSSLPMYLVIISTFVIYILSLTWFPQIQNQYTEKSTLFLSPGNYLADKFNFDLPLQLGNVFYQNVILNQELVYAIILGAFIFVLGKIFLYIHRKVAESVKHSKNQFPLTLPISNISHSVAATPLWSGPLQIVFSFIGLFRLDSKGQCTLLTVLIVAVLPDILFLNAISTGALREISFLVIIIPITSALGFWQVISYLETRNPQNKKATFIVWLVVLLTVILTASLATSYYLPQVAGEDYVVNGMQWLSQQGNPSDVVVGYGLRQVPIYTNMTDVTYGLQNGYETRTFLGLLRSTLLDPDTIPAGDLQQLFNLKYIMISDKIVANLGETGSMLEIDNDTALNKIYSSKDYGIYDIISSEIPSEKKVLAGNITVEKTTTSIQVQTDAYKIVLNGNYPVIEQFGTPTDNSLGEGFFLDSIQISGLRKGYVNPFTPLNETSEQNSTVDAFMLNNISIVPQMNNNQLRYQTILKDPNGNNEASLVIQYTFYPTSIKREFLISNDWVTSTAPSQMNTEVSTDLFVPLNDFIITGNQTAVTRHIYPSQDNVKLNNNFDELYIYDRDSGICLKNEPTAPSPNVLTYRGSTIYNMSSVSFSQTDSLEPGATLHITQFLSPGDQITAENNIHSQDGISLLDYPDGIVPIMLVGYRTPTSDLGSSDYVNEGYNILLNDSVPYTEGVLPQQNIIMSQNSSISEGGNVTIQNTTKIGTVDLSSINSRGIKIIGSSSTGVANTFNNYSTQASDIEAVISAASESHIPLIGYMPSMLEYNLDTLKIISDDHFSLMLPTYVSPPYYGIIGQQIRDPELAMYHNSPTNIALLPVSAPTSSELSSQIDPFTTLSAWKATIDESVAMNEMALFIIRSGDIGNPAYTDYIQSLISYANNNGLTFTTPDVIAEHYKEIQNIQYNGTVLNDVAMINMTNKNNKSATQVAFQVILPTLESGEYYVSKGKIVRMTQDNGNVILDISTDIPAYQTQEILVQPMEPRGKIIVNLPKHMTEGLLNIKLQDEAGEPLRNAEVIIDTKYYLANAQGEVDVNLNRGIHTIKIQCPGFETYQSNLDVKGRLFGIIDEIRSL